jgi:hypothetical protein
MKTFSKTMIAAFALSALLACDDKATDDAQANAPDEQRQKANAASDQADEPTETEGAELATTEGSITFSIDGKKSSFDYLPADQNMAMSMSTMLVAHPGPDATAEFSITAMNFDVRKVELPATLKLDMKKAMQDGDHMKFAKAPKPMIQYTTPKGVAYRGYAEITFESFEDGLVKGSVADMQLGTVKPKDKNEPPVELSGVTFQAKLSPM